MNDLENSILIPKPVGYWVLGSETIPGGWSTMFSIYRKPIWIHRKMTTFLLGWEWKDA